MYKSPQHPLTYIFVVAGALGMLYAVGYGVWWVVSKVFAAVEPIIR